MEEVIRSSASKLSTLLWNISNEHQTAVVFEFNNHNDDVNLCLENYIDTVETLRASLNHSSINILQESQSIVTTQWFTVCSDLLDETVEILKNFDPTSIRKYLRRDSNTRRLVDQRFLRLDHMKQSFQRILKDFSIAAAVTSTSVLDEAATTATTSLQLLSNVTQYFYIPINSEGLEFWLTNFGVSKYSVDYSEFQSRLNEQFLFPDRTWIQIKAILDFAGNNLITFHKWASFLENFGGYFESILDTMDHMNVLLNDFCFVGYVSLEESISILKCSPPGSFLIRFLTSTQPNGFVLSYRVEDDDDGNFSFRQCFITSSKRENGKFELDDDEYDGHFFASIQDIIAMKMNECRSCCKFPSPLIRFVARLNFFNGFLTKEETVRLLQDQPNGTFLFRFSSSQPGSLILGFKVEGTVHQARVIIEKDGRFRLGTGGSGSNNQPAYYSVEELIHLNQHRLKTPFRGGYCYSITINTDRTPLYQYYDRYGGLLPLEFS